MRVKIWHFTKPTSKSPFNSYLYISTEELKTKKVTKTNEKRLTGCARADQKFAAVERINKIYLRTLRANVYCFLLCLVYLTVFYIRVGFVVTRNFQSLTEPN